MLLCAAAAKPGASKDLSHVFAPRLEVSTQLVSQQSVAARLRHAPCAHVAPLPRCD